jgi:hypothetical protein
MPAQKQVPLFSHLPQYEHGTTQSFNVGFSSSEIHPSIIALGLKYPLQLVPIFLFIASSLYNYPCI